MTARHLRLPELPCLPRLLRRPIYTKQFGVALLAQMRQEEELRTNETDWPWLRVPPTPTEPLGTMTAEKLVRELQPAARAVRGDPRARRDSLLAAAPSPRAVPGALVWLAALS